MVVDPNATQLNQALERRAGDIPFPVDQKDVQPLWLFTGGHDEFGDHSGRGRYQA
jgi:hypothetical protein